MWLSLNAGSNGKKLEIQLVHFRKSSLIYRIIIFKDNMENTEVVYIKVCFLSKVPYGSGKCNPDFSLFSLFLNFLIVYKFLNDRSNTL